MAGLLAILSQGLDGKPEAEAGLIARSLRREDHDPVGVRDWQRPKVTVDQAEDGRVGADPQRDRQDHEQGEARRLSKLARGVAEVVDEALHT